MLEVLEQHMGMVIFFGGFLLVILICYKIWKIRKLFELDKQHKLYYPDGQIKMDGRSRNIWDYNFFPGLSKVWHISEWQILFAIVILVVLLLLYSFTKDQNLLNFLGVNIGVVLGMMIKITK